MLEDEDTYLLHSIQAEGRPNMAFYSYLERHNISTRDVALAAKVRLLTIWNIGHYIPVRGIHARQVRTALLELTGIPYNAYIATLSDDI